MSSLKRIKVLTPNLSLLAPHRKEEGIGSSLFHDKYSFNLLPSLPGLAFDRETLKVAHDAMELTFNEASYEYGKKVAMAEIDRKGMGVGVFAYGEAEIDSFAWVLHHAHPKPGEVFYDLVCEP